MLELMQGSLETFFAGALFVGYLLLWTFKRFRQRRVTGVDPEVLADATTPLQRYFSFVVKLMSTVVVAVVVLHHLFQGELAGFVPVSALDRPLFDLAGLGLGVGGLGICALAQATMGASWRVGIDEQVSTELVTRGIFAVVRNPTYLGLFVVNTGLWLIWPTWATASYWVLFLFFLEIQVRCEEEHLLAIHGARYADYLKRTKRYLPWIY